MIEADGIISVQVLNEFAAVLRRKFRLEWNAIADVPRRWVPASVDVAVHMRAVALARSHDFGFYDALIVASALATGCDTLLTEDLQAGRRIAGMTIVDPLPEGRRRMRPRRMPAPSRMQPTPASRPRPAAPPSHSSPSLIRHQSERPWHRP